MKSIGIFVGRYSEPWDGETMKNGMGGSETWAYEVASEFSRRGYDVIMYAFPKTDFDPLPNFHLVNYEKYFNDVHHRSYDYFIYSRFVDVIDNNIKCDNIYVMVHDVCVISNVEHPDLHLNKVKKYCYLSDWHRDYLMSLYKELTPDKMQKVSNGYSKALYVGNYEKTNSMVWSSSLVRGFSEFYRYVFMPVKEVVPDFSLTVCCGTLFDADKALVDRYSLLPDINEVGKLSKSDLARLQMQSKVWVYNGVFPETFCITAVENAAAGNVLVTPLSYGLSTTLKDISYLKEFNLPILNKNNADRFVEFTIKSLKDDSFRTECVKESLKLANEYSWSNTVDEFEKMFKENE